MCVMNEKFENSPALIVGIGELLWDVLPDGKKIGGAPCNFAYHVSQFGLPAIGVSAVGNDDLGEELKAAVLARDIECNIAEVDYPTGTVQVSLDAAGVPCYDIKEGAAWDNIPFTDALRDIASVTRAVSFGSLAQRSEVSRATIKAFLDAMPDGDGQYKVFDINLRLSFYTPQVISDSLARCNVLKINDEELEVVSGMLGISGGSQQERCIALLEKYGLRTLILTCGVNGSYVFTGKEVSFVETPRVDVVDTVGAGDSFTGAFVAGMLSGMPLREAHRLAVDTSAYVCSCAGAMPKLPESLVGRVSRL